MKYSESALHIQEEVIKRMAKYNMDPPPSTNNTAVNNWLNNLHDTLTFVFQNIDNENMTDDFLSTIGNSSESGEEK